MSGFDGDRIWHTLVGKGGGGRVVSTPTSALSLSELALPRGSAGSGDPIDISFR